MASSHARSGQGSVVLLGQRDVMDRKGGRSHADVRALDADDIHPTPAHPLRTCCPSPAPYPSRSMVFKLDSVAEKKKNRCGDRECRRAWRNQTKEESMRKQGGGDAICTHWVPIDRMYLGLVTALVAPFHVVPSKREKLPREGGCRSLT